jgi:2-iminobutanoate/2-iminopropanoate deaminase
MKIAAPLLTIYLLTLTGVSSGQELKKEYLDPVPQESRSTAVKVKGGTMLFLAGHTASLPQVNVDHGNFEAQFKRVFDKINTTLTQAGGTFDDIVTMSVFLTDLRYIPEFNKLTKEIFKKGFPAVTFVEVSHLARPQLIMEIQPIAVIP